MSDGQYGGHVGFSRHYFRSQLIIKNLEEMENKSVLFMILIGSRREQWWQKWQNRVSCQCYQVRKYKATIPLSFSSKKIIFSILANNSLFCVGFHLSVIIKMRELEYFWLTFTLWTFKIASPPKTKLKLNQDIEINDNAKTEAILTGCDSNDKFDLVV